MEWPGIPKAQKAAIIRSISDNEKQIEEYQCAIRELSDENTNLHNNIHELSASLRKCDQVVKKHEAELEEANYDHTEKQNESVYLEYLLKHQSSPGYKSKILRNCLAPDLRFILRVHEPITVAKLTIKQMKNIFRHLTHDGYKCKLDPKWKTQMNWTNTEILLLSNDGTDCRHILI